jgi:hypothetical protein
VVNALLIMAPPPKPQQSAHPLRKGNTQSIHFYGILRLRAKHFGVTVGLSAQRRGIMAGHLGVWTPVFQEETYELDDQWASP